jgi:tetratricopeptide (TPR) repeat protein
MEKETIQYLERGKGGEPRLSTMEQLMAGLGVSMAAFEEMSVLAEEIRQGETPDRWVGPFLFEGSLLRKAREFSRKMGHLQKDSFREFVIRNRVQELAAKDREVAAQIGIYLRGRENLVEIVRGDRGCHLWSVAVWLCDESLTAITEDSGRASKFSEAALAIAELVLGEERFRRRLAGFCWAHVGNIRRVASAFQAADAAFATCRDLWSAGSAGDPYGLLDAGRVLGMEASLRRAQGRLPEALRLLENALPVATTKERPYLNLNVGKVLEDLGDSNGAIRILENAAQEMPQHLLFTARFNLGVNLCHLSRFEEAEAVLAEVARLAVSQGNQSNRARLRWLSGRVAAGRGRMTEAIGYLRSAQSDFLRQGNAYDAALATLDLAKLYLEQGDAATVRRLADEMAPVFVDKGVHQYAQEALQLFQEAAARESASAAFVLQVAQYLLRARRAPGLRFELAA